MTGNLTKVEQLLESESEVDKNFEDGVFKQRNYSREQLQLDLMVLKDWLKNQHHLPPSRMRESDIFYKLYLTKHKGSLEKAKRKIDAYYTLRGKSKIYSDRNVLDPAYRKSCDSCITVIVPKASNVTGEYLAVCQLIDKDVKAYDFLNILKRVVNLAEMGLRLFRYRTVAKTILLVDYQLYTPSHVMLLSPSMLTDAILLIQEAFPSMARAVLFNVPGYLEIVLNSIIKPLLSKKIYDRLFITSGGFEEIHKVIDKRILPKEYGGDYEVSIQELNDAWNEYEISRHDWFINELSEQNDETKRIVTNRDDYKTNDSYFGVHGSLKKLVID